MKVLSNMWYLHVSLSLVCLGGSSLYLGYVGNNIIPIILFFGSIIYILVVVGFTYSIINEQDNIIVEQEVEIKELKELVDTIDEVDDMAKDILLSKDLDLILDTLSKNSNEPLTRGDMHAILSILGRF